MSKLMAIADELYTKIEPLADILDAAWHLLKDSPTTENKMAYNSAMSKFTRAEAIAKAKG